MTKYKFSCKQCDHFKRCTSKSRNVICNCYTKKVINIQMKGFEKMLANNDIRQTAKEKGVKLWEVADKLGIADTTMSRWLRKELPTDKKQSMLDIIDQIVAEKDRREVPFSNGQTKNTLT